MPTERATEQAVLGGQYFLSLAEVPASASRDLIGKRLVDAGALTVVGDYWCVIDLGGLFTGAYVHLKATIAASTASSEVDTVYAQGFVRERPSSGTAYQGFAGDGALASTVLQTSSLTTLKGERYGRVKITLGAAPNVTFTQAEINGL